MLVIVIIFLEVFWVFNTTFRADTFDVNPETYLKFSKEVDSLRDVQFQRSTPKLYRFNPNYITDYKGYTLGMTAEEINRLHLYRAKNKWINSTKEFQNVTKVSDSLLHTISAYFKFPDWVSKSVQNSTLAYNTSTKTTKQKIDLNTATALQLQNVYGIGAYYSERIIRYRDAFDGGFISEIQLYDIQGLKPDVIENILKEFTVKTPRQIKKINLNTATIDQLVGIQHIDYELAYEIIELRMLKDGFSELEELTKVKEFPKEKLEIIKLYLSLN